MNYKFKDDGSTNPRYLQRINNIIREATLETLVTEFMRRRKLALGWQEDFPLSQIALRKLINQLMTIDFLKERNAKHKRLTDFRARWSTKCLKNPKRNLLHTAAVLRSDIFTMPQIAELSSSLIDARLIRSDMNWSVHHQETPFLIYLDEGVAPELRDSAVRIKGRSLPPVWGYYIGLTDRFIFPVVTRSLLHSGYWWEYLMNLADDGYFAPWQKKVVIDEVNHLPRRFKC